MKDQAEKLRKLMNTTDSQKKFNNKITSTAKVLAITSGKGGVGKTNFAINLAISIKRLGYSVLVLDADFGLANIEILTGTNIKYTIADCINEGKDIEEIIGDGPEGIKLISGGSGFHELSIMNEENIIKLLKDLKNLESNTDFIIIDTGAGVSKVVLDFVMAANEVFVVTTADPTSVMDGYTMLKTLTINGYRGKLNIVINNVNNRTEAYNTYYKLNRASNSFLKQDITFFGYLEKSNIVSKAVKSQIPFLLSSPKSPISKKINVMALNLVDSKEHNNIQQHSRFTEKLKYLFFGKDDN